MHCEATAQGPTLTIWGQLAFIDPGRPDEGNRLTRAMMARLAALVAEADQDAVSAIVITSRGPVFCAGRDGQNETCDGLTAVAIRKMQMQPVLDVYAAFRNASIPVIGRVHGDALGFGAALAGSCDMAIAASDARFSFPEIQHGIAPTMAISSVLERVLPARLSYLIYTGREIDAATACEAGLISALLPAESFDSEFEAILQDLTSRPRETLQTIKEYFRNARNMPREAAADYAGALLALLKAS